MARLARSPESSAPRTTNILDAACGDFCHCGRRKCCHRLGLDNSSLNPKRSGANSSSVMCRQRKPARASGGRGPLGPLPVLVRAGTIAVQLRSLASISAETCATSQPCAGDRSRFLAEPRLRWSSDDALEFSNGAIVLVTNLATGQRATVLQLPAKPMRDAPPSLARAAAARAQAGVR